MRKQVTIDESKYEYLLLMERRAYHALQALHDIMDATAVAWQETDSPATLRDRYLDELPRRIHATYLAGQRAAR